jgi:hypothetical protein
MCPNYGGGGEGMDGHPGSTSPTRAESQLRRWRRRRGDGRTSREYIAYTAILHPSRADAQLASPCRGPSLRPTLPFSRSHRRGSVGGPLVTTLADGVTIGSEPLPRYRPDGLRIPRDLPPWSAWVCIATDSLLSDLFGLSLRYVTGVSRVFYRCFTGV